MDHFVGIDLHSNSSYISIIKKDKGCGSELKVWLVLNQST